MKRLSTLPLLWLFGAAALAQPPKQLDDNELSQVAAGDGISIALHLELNQPQSGVPASESRLTIGQTVNGNTNYIVVRNPSGVIDMFALGLSANTAPDGTNYVAVALPTYVKFTNVGFD